MKIKKHILKAVSAILCVVLVCSLSVLAFAQGSVVNFVLSSTVYSAERDSYLSQDSFKSGDIVYLKLASTQISNLGGLAASVNYDTSLFEFMENKSVCLIEDSQVQYFVDAATGTLRIIYENGYYNKETSITGAMFYLAFNVKAFDESNTPAFSLQIDALYDNSLAQKDIESNLNDSITVHLTAEKISSATLELFRALQTITYPDSKESIDKAKTAYNQLSSSQKQLLSTKYPNEYEWLSTATARYNRLAEQAAKEQILAEVEKFKNDNAKVLSLTKETVSLSDDQAVAVAKQALENCSDSAKTYLQNENKLIEVLSERIDELKDIKAEVDDFIGNETYAHIWNRKIIENDFDLNYTNYVSFVQLALLNYDLLSDEAKQLVKAEHEWLTLLNNEINKYLGNDAAAAELAEKVSTFQKTYLYVFTLNEAMVTQADRGAIQMVIDAYNALEDEQLKEALKFKVEQLKSMLELLDEAEDEDTETDTSNDKERVVTKTVTKTKTKNVTDTLVRTLRGQGSYSDTILALFVLLAIAILIMFSTYLLCQRYRKKLAAIDFDGEEEA